MIFAHWKNLRGLQSLNLSENQISDIGSLEKLTSLKTLELNNNKNSIIEISSLGKLISLQSLHLSGNQINDLHFLDKQVGLEILDLSKNKINDISFLKNLTGLKELYLSYNKICDLTPLRHLIIEQGLTINLIHSTTGISVDNNPLTIPPPEIVKRGRKPVVDYFLKLEKEEIELFESKMLFVGLGAVGKTWLLHRLITGETPQEGETTEGISIKQWHFAKNEIKDFRINLWDFGGQEIYHATHQFFLSKRSLYLFIWDARKEQDIVVSFDYWLNIISLLSNNSPIIVVMNKCDERSKAIEEETLKNKFKNIVGFHKVSAKFGTGIEYLKDIIQKNILNLPQVGNNLPKVWNDIRNELEQLGKQSISNSEYKNICLKYGLNAKDAEFIGDYYHDVGVFLHFRDNHILKDILFLNPEWATNAVYKIIDTEEVVNNYGKFHLDQLKTIWDQYEDDKFKYLIELMKRFELCFQLGSSENYIVPELLRPEYTNLEWDYSDNLQFEYDYSFMPAGIITRFITRQPG
jgi:small GTP-binding protein